MGTNITAIIYKQQSVFLRLIQLKNTTDFDSSRRVCYIDNPDIDFYANTKYMILLNEDFTILTKKITSLITP